MREMHQHHFGRSSHALRTTHYTINHLQLISSGGDIWQLQPTRLSRPTSTSARSPSLRSAPAGRHARWISCACYYWNSDFRPADHLVASQPDLPYEQTLR